MGSAAKQREYWKNNPKKYAIHREKMRLYGHTKRGREVNNKAQAKFMATGYYKEYMKKRARKAIDQGMCRTCYKRKVFKEYSQCKKCRDYAKEYRNTHM